MSYDLKDVVYELGGYFVLRVAKGYEIYKEGCTHATRCAVIGWGGEKGLERAKAEVSRRLLLAL